jgi:hypothetical protein
MRWPLQRDCAAFYGNPDPAGRGAPSRLWEDKELVRIEPPYPMVLAWDTAKPVHSILFHRRAAGALTRCLEAMLKAYGMRLEKMGMHLYGGSYNFRLMRGSASLSMHSYGCAIDLNPEANPFGRRWVAGGKMMDPGVVAIFEAEGFTWGGRWRRPDAMHFQAARVR